LEDPRHILHHASLLLSAIVDSSDDAIVSKDLNGIVTSWNKGAERLFGYTAEEAIGKSITLIIPQDRLGEEPEILRRLQRGERVDHFETIRQRKDGTLLHVSLTISPVRDPSGKIIGASKIARDVTDRRRAEEAIQALNAQLTADLSALERMQQLSTRLVQAGDYRVLLREIVEASVEIAQAEAGSIKLFENGGLRVIASWGSAADAHTVHSTSLTSRFGDALGLLSMQYRDARTPDSREIRMLDVLARQAADLIERMRSEQALRQSEEQFRELAEAGPQFIWISRPDATVEYVNQRWTNYSGLDLEHSRNAAQLAPAIHPDDFPEMLERWRQSLETGEGIEMEARLRRADGVFRWFMIRSVALRDENGNVVRWLGASTDIDEQKAVEDELRRLNHDLEQFAFSASHDLQEPLRSIKIYSELLTQRHREGLSGEALEFLDYLRGAATRMEMLVRDLLAYTQVGKIDSPTTPIDADAVLRETLANLQGAIDDSGARVSSEPLPPLRIHSTHLNQLFQNLIGNAIKYRSPERTPEVRLTAARQQDHWKISIRDNGIGIEPQYKERIFGLFKRLHGGDEYSGTGIGLAICQRIVERYHGRIWVESEPGRGSTFSFTLPF